jgi:magnesium chelatase family protein
VHDVEHAKLLAKRVNAGQSGLIRNKVSDVYDIQKQRFGAAGRFNSGMNNQQIRELARLSPAAKELLDSAAQKLDISARAYVRTVKVARTIADLDGSEDIKPVHISEALQFRQQTAAVLQFA